MKKSSQLQRCAVHGAKNGASNHHHHSQNGSALPRNECETEVTYNKGRQAVVRMLGKIFRFSRNEREARVIVYIIVSLC